MLVREVLCKSLLNRSRLADYCVNPYVGCGHGCKYCYAESYSRRFTQHKETWGQFVDVKINAVKTLRGQVSKRGKGRVFLSSLTDAYQPLERKYRITRELLKILLEYQFPISIQTKSSLVLRDLDLLQKFERCEVGFTLTSMDENVREIFEPHSSPTSERLNALKKLKEKGLPTYVFFGPILPLLSDRNLEAYFQTLAELEVNYVYVDKLNFKPGLLNVMNKTVRTEFPQLMNEWQKALRSRSAYYTQLRSIIQNICAEKKLEIEMCF